ncbi:hypothetical protein N8996_01910 [Candidatus Poseidonia alphae]|nr:hypothetical protein [Candidatus Poseidonia alphae]
MSEHKFTTFDPNTTSLENLSSSIISINPTSGTLKVNNIDLNEGNLNNLGSINGTITTTDTIKVSSNSNLGFKSGGIAFINSGGDLLNDTISFFFNENASYGTYDLIINDANKVECNNYYFNNLSNNSQFLISITNSTGNSFIFKKNNAAFFQDNILLNDTSILFGFEDDFTIANQDTAILSIVKINSKIFINFQSYYVK